MPVLYARAAVAGGRNKLHCKPGFVLAGALIAALTVAGCSATQPSPRAALAADAQVPVAVVRYSSVTAPYTRQRPVEPLPWREQNQRVAPQAQP